VSFAKINTELSEKQSLLLFTGFLADVISSAENSCVNYINQSCVVSSSIQLKNSERLGPRLFFGFLIGNNILGKFPLIFVHVIFGL
jgi:hypothetical protein